MDHRRKFSKDIVQSEKFLGMPLSTQALYFHLGVIAENKGILINAKAMCRAIVCESSDLDRLVELGYIIPISSWQHEIVHWYENNGIGETAKKRNNYKYRKWRESVLQRDGACVKCGEKDGLVAHHIMPFALYPTLRTDVNNGLTLCSSCHRKLHKEIRKCQTLSGSK